MIIVIIKKGDNMKREELIYKNQREFDCKDIFECGQCFRWHREEDGSYTGVTKIGVLNVKKVGNDVVIVGDIEEKENLKSFCDDYFDMSTNYREIQDEISKNDKTMKEAIEFGSGIRILNQNSWELLISFIISAANNIPRISKTIENLSKGFGTLVKSDVSGELKDYYLFPSPKQLKKATMDELRGCNLGFRDKYVFEATRLVSEDELSLEMIEKDQYVIAKKELLKIPGVGSKVADCILLFSMKKKEAFPVDTWIKQIMNEVYIDSKNVRKIEEYARNKFGENSGIAQQYLFYYKREQ